MELWMPFPKWKNKYEVSTSGRVRSIERTVTRSNGKELFVRARILKPAKNGKGHLFVYLYRNGKGYKYYIHRMVLETFVGPCPPGMECRHFPDRDPSNNHFENLQWGTSKENAGDRATHGTHNIGERNGSSKLSAESVLKIRRLHKKGYSRRQLAERFNVTKGNIRAIVLRKTWKEVVKASEIVRKPRYE